MWVVLGPECMIFPNTKLGALQRSSRQRVKQCRFSAHHFSFVLTVTNALARKYGIQNTQKSKKSQGSSFHGKVNFQKLLQTIFFSVYIFTWLSLRSYCVSFTLILFGGEGEGGIGRGGRRRQGEGGRRRGRGEDEEEASVFYVVFLNYYKHSMTSQLDYLSKFPFLLLTHFFVAQ